MTLLNACTCHISPQKMAWNSSDHSFTGFLHGPCPVERREKNKPWLRITNLSRVSDHVFIRMRDGREKQSFLCPPELGALPIGVHCNRWLAVWWTAESEILISIRSGARSAFSLVMRESRDSAELEWYMALVKMNVAQNKWMQGKVPGLWRGGK